MFFKIANILMSYNNLHGGLRFPPNSTIVQDTIDGAGGSSSSTTTTTTSANTSDIADQEWFKQLISAIKSWVTPLLILACAAGAVWAIILGIKMAQADDKGKRDEAKAHLVSVIIALVAVIALILIFTIVGNTIAKDGIS